jgi:hypothetical protein
VEAARRVDDHRPEPALCRSADGLAADLQRGLDRVADDRDPELGPERPELVDRRRPVDVGRRQERVLALPLEVPAELGCQGRLARALEPYQQDDGRRLRGHREAVAAAAEQLDHFVVDDLDDLLAGRDGAKHLLARGLGPDLLDEGPDDLEVDVRLQEGDAHLAERLLDVLLAEPSVAPEAVEDGREA